MASWNYRVFHRTVPDGTGGTTDEFTIREAYYNAGGEVDSWTAEPSHPYGETKLELMEDIELTPDAEALA